MDHFSFFFFSWDVFIPCYILCIWKAEFGGCSTTRRQSLLKLKSSFYSSSRLGRIQSDLVHWEDAILVEILNARQWSEILNSYRPGTWALLPNLKFRPWIGTPVATGAPLADRQEGIDENIEGETSRRTVGPTASLICLWAKQSNGDPVDKPGSREGLTTQPLPEPWVALGMLFGVQWQSRWRMMAHVLIPEKTHMLLFKGFWFNLILDTHFSGPTRKIPAWSVVPRFCC